ncbi:MAG: GNAT family N-acetyltransferase [Saccharospirillaceae bacterium]|nr:GNAT family N-acetyltransferase [Pseudomonadales bacterium]NRB78581.1 GNAT family N-acetyltransferase [Saccharospirillaceae bacterium]
MTLSFKQAKITDAQTLTNITLTAKAHWQYPTSWLDFWKDDLTISAEFIKQNHVVIASAKGQAVGFYSLLFSSTKPFATLENLWITPDLIGCGLGRSLFEQAVSDCKQQHKSGFILDADPNAKGFYQHMGAVQYAELNSLVLDIKRVLPRMRLTF